MIQKIQLKNNPVRSLFVKENNTRFISATNKKKKVKVDYLIPPQREFPESFRQRR